MEPAGIARTSGEPQAYGDWNGYLISDDPVLDTWESTLGVPGQRSIITTYFGGRSGAAGLPAPEAHAPTSPREIARNLTSLCQHGSAGLDGLHRGFDELAWSDHWVADPWAPTPPIYRASTPVTAGTSACPRAPSTSPASTLPPPTKGLLEGALESGERAAAEISAGTER
jgi:hypothetical protein